MANFLYPQANQKLWRGELDIEDDTIMARLFMTNTTVHNQPEIEFLDEITLPDVCDGDSYGDITLANLLVEIVDLTLITGHIKLTGDDLTFATLGAGTRPNSSLVIYKFVTNDADSFPIFHIDHDSQGNGQNLVIPIPSSGFALYGKPC